MAIAIVKNDSIIYLRSFGVKNITTQEPVTPDTRFQLASISKSFTTATITSMVETASSRGMTGLHPHTPVSSSLTRG